MDFLNKSYLYLPLLVNVVKERPPKRQLMPAWWFDDQIETYCMPSKDCSSSRLDTLLQACTTCKVRSVLLTVKSRAVARLG